MLISPLGHLARILVLIRDCDSLLPVEFLLLLLKADWIAPFYDLDSPSRYFCASWSSVSLRWSNLFAVIVIWRHRSQHLTVALYAWKVVRRWDLFRLESLHMDLAREDVVGQDLLGHQPGANMIFHLWWSVRRKHKWFWIGQILVNLIVRLFAINWVWISLLDRLLYL